MLLIFDISGGELVLILTVVLLFFGSKGLPGVARTMGRVSRQLRDASAEVQREIQKGANEVKRGYDEQRRAITLDQPDQPATVPDAAPAETPAPPAAEERPASDPS